jgi:molybdate transport system permease protein
MHTSIAEILLLTLRIAGLATLVVVVPATAVGYLLARRDFPGKRVLSALVGLPLVLPPTAVGYLLLRLFAFDGPLGRDVIGIDLGVLLSVKGAVLAAAVMSFPLVARTARVAFEGVDPRLERMARTLGHGPAATFARVSLPLARRGLLAGTLLGFTRALGEFGATATVAGIVPGRTETVASAIFAAQSAGDDRRALALMALALALGFVAILVAELFGGRGPVRGGPRGGGGVR